MILPRDPVRELSDAVSGAGAIASLRRPGLVDEYRLIVHPVVLGGGTPLFTEVEGPFSLRHTKTTRFAMGLDVLSYVPA